jgi:hypothetical protein
MLQSIQKGDEKMARMRRDLLETKEHAERASSSPEIGCSAI